MTTSYSNTGGSGDRRSTMWIYTNAVMGGRDETQLIDGSYGNVVWFASGVTNGFFEFDFSAIGKRVIDAFRFYQSDTTSQGSWRFLGWNGSSWDELKASFTLQGGANNTTPNEYTFTNTTAYDVYRLEQVGGSTSNSPFVNEFEFKIESTGTAADTLWSNTGGAGDRTASIPTISSTATFTGTLNHLINGNLADNDTFLVSGQSGKIIQFDFGSSKIIDTFKWYATSPGNPQGTFRFDGSNDNFSTYTTLMSAASLTANPNGRASEPNVYRFTNTTGFTSYRLFQTTGTTSNTGNINEIEFKLAAGIVEMDLTVLPSLGVSMAVTLQRTQSFVVNMSLGASVASSFATNVFLPAAPALGLSEAVTLYLEKHIPVAPTLGLSMAVTLQRERQLDPITFSLGANMTAKFMHAHRPPVVNILT